MRIHSSLFLFASEVSQHFVHAAGSVAAKIHRDIRKAKILKRSIDVGTNILIQKLFKFAGQHFDAGNHAMDANPHLMKTQIQQELFRLIHHSQLLFTDCFPVYKAGRKTGIGKSFSIIRHSKCKMIITISMGYEVGPCRLPLCDMDPTNAENLYKTLKQYGLISGGVRAGSVTVSGMKNIGNVLRGNV